MKTPKVDKCQVSECSYNMNDCCHAMAITVGDSMTPRCDTFCQSSTKGGDTGCVATVGACKTFRCMYNNNLGCGASSISVGYQEQEPDCLTFRSR